MGKIDELSIEELMEENAKRRKELKRAMHYDPVKGIGCFGERTRVRRYGMKGYYWVPTGMVKDKEYERDMGAEEWEKLRHRYDFEYWAATCVHIRHKVTGKIVPLTLNEPQRRLLAAMEGQRSKGEPVRVILLKARQWGGSTLVQMYFAWIQCCLRRHWNSLICANVNDISSTIRGMFSTLLREYPKGLWQGEQSPKLRTYEGSGSIRIIPDRDCKIATVSARCADSARGLDNSLAHLSEIAYWPETVTFSPEAVIQSVCAGIPVSADTAVVMESTANGVGNFFHSMWLRAKAGEVAYKPVFVAWYNIEMNQTRVADAAAMVKRLTPYEKRLWEMGLTLEQILWYHRKRLEVSNNQRMNAEYPTTDIEAFNATVKNVFEMESVERLRPMCAAKPETGDVRGAEPKGPGALRDVRWQAAENGELKVWERPMEATGRNAYVVSVDVGGRSESADWSVIAVFRRLDARGRALERPRIVAQWRGHAYHDLLAWKAAAIAQWYNRALLVVESNTLETEEMDAGMILEVLAQNYRNMYVRRSLDTLTMHLTERVGFHTNRATKALIIDNLLGVMRDEGYVERDEMALNEMACYEKLSNGAYAARKGCHDDILMTRAIGLYVISTMRTAPALDKREGNALPDF